jgi:hypothetical protein
MVDGLTYGYGQFGDWQSLTQRAWAYGVEAGYRFTDVWAKPWLRAGINSASGDTDPNDRTHGTFFQILPTARTYAQLPFFNLMNVQDLFASLLLRPHAMVSPGPHRAGPARPGAEPRVTRPPTNPNSSPVTG